MLYYVAIYYSTQHNVTICNAMLSCTIPLPYCISSHPIPSNHLIGSYCILSNLILSYSTPQLHTWGRARMISAPCSCMRSHHHQLSNSNILPLICKDTEREVREKEWILKWIDEILNGKRDKQRGWLQGLREMKEKTKEKTKRKWRRKKSRKSRKRTRM